MVKINNQPIPDTLYHYCNPAAFLNIIQSKSLWLSDSYAANDYVEGSWAYPIIDKVIAKYRNDQTDHLFNEFIQTFKLNAPRIYMNCLSSDGDLLSQWRGYALDGKGFAIGFNPKYFEFKVQLPTRNISPKEAIGLSHVIYDREEQENLIESLTIEFALKQQLTGHLTILLQLVSLIAKNPKFAEEKEWRIIHTPNILIGIEPNVPPFEIWGGISEMKFYLSYNQSIVPYFELSFADSKKHPAINEIILGPKNPSSPTAIRMLLNQHGFQNVAIKRSEATYR